MGSLGMVYAQILNGIVKNTIMLDDETQAHVFAKHHDACVRIDGLTPQPAIGWFYDGATFSKVHNLLVKGGIPVNVPKGHCLTFSPFTISKGDYEFEVFLSGDIIHIGCQEYNYRWCRYALWMNRVNRAAAVGPLLFCEDGSTRYGSNFHIMRDDVDAVYVALCMLP
jgi:hypothetical protein